MKRCAKCGEQRPLNLFYVHRQEKDGRNCYCKACNKKMRKQAYLRNRVRILQASKIYYGAHKKEILEKTRKWKETHKDQVRCTAKRYRDVNREKIRENSRKYSGRYRETRRAYYQQNKGRIKQYVEVYRQHHKKDAVRRQMRWILRNMDKYRCGRRKYYQRLPDSVIRTMLSASTGLPRFIFSTDLITDKRDVVRLNRTLRKFRKEASL